MPGTGGRLPMSRTAKMTRKPSATQHPVTSFGRIVAPVTKPGNEEAGETLSTAPFPGCLCLSCYLVKQEAFRIPTGKNYRLFYEAVRDFASVTGTSGLISKRV
jgi:hypothetical protein